MGPKFSAPVQSPWGPPNLLYNGYRVSFPGVQRPGNGVNHLPSSSAEVKERLELYLYSLSETSWEIMEWTLFTCTDTCLKFLLKSEIISNGNRVPSGLQMATIQRLLISHRTVREATCRPPHRKTEERRQYKNITPNVEEMTSLQWLNSSRRFGTSWWSYLEGWILSNLILLWYSNLWKWNQDAVPKRRQGERMRQQQCREKKKKTRMSNFFPI